jgi:ABC-type amino acid transport substrate-binding protein
MSLSTLRLLLLKQLSSFAYSILFNFITFSFKDNPFIYLILKEVIKPIIKQEVLNKDRPIKKAFNKYIKSLNNKGNKVKSITIIF